MKLVAAFALLLSALLLPAAAVGQEIPLQQFSSSTPQIDLRVYVDISVEFWIQGARVRYNAGGSRDPRNDGSAYSAALPNYAPPNLKVKKRDGRGDIVVLEQPSAQNAWTLKLRISDPKGGEDRYHAQITWDGEVSAPPTSSGGYVEITEMSATADGGGRLRVGGQNYNLAQTSVSLIPSGRAILSFMGDSQPRFTGTWSQNGSRIALTLDNALGAAGSSASGTIQLSGDRIRSINLGGQAAGQGQFELSFNQRGDYKDFTKPAGPASPQAPVNTQAGTPISGGKVNNKISSPTPPKSPNPPVAARAPSTQSVSNLSQRLRGDGYLESAGAGDQDDVLKEALVRLDQGGRARFELEGRSYWSILGSWRQTSSDRIEVTLEQLNSAPASGRATVLLLTNGRGGSPTVQQLEMSVAASRVGALDVRFRPR